LEALAANPDAYLDCQTKAFLLDFLQNSETAKLAELKGLLGQFVFAAQSLTDAGDPSNCGPIPAAIGTPLLITEVIGDGMANPSVQVFPNQTINTPIGGTEPLIRALALLGNPFNEPLKVKLLMAYRLKSPAYCASPKVTIPRSLTRMSTLEPKLIPRLAQEMQSQAVSYFSSDGRAVLVTDDAFIVSANQAICSN